MRHRNEYSHYHDNTQHSADGQVGERPRVAVRAPFNVGRVTRPCRLIARVRAVNPYELVAVSILPLPVSRDGQGEWCVSAMRLAPVL